MSERVREGEKRRVGREGEERWAGGRGKERNDECDDTRGRGMRDPSLPSGMLLGLGSVPIIPCCARTACRAGMLFPPHHSTMSSPRSAQAVATNSRTRTSSSCNVSSWDAHVRTPDIVENQGEDADDTSDEWNWEKRKQWILRKAECARSTLFLKTGITYDTVGGTHQSGPGCATPWCPASRLVERWRRPRVWGSLPTI